jgi:hypothetical protein
MIGQYLFNVRTDMYLDLVSILNDLNPILMGDQSYLCINVDFGDKERKHAYHFSFILASGHEVIHLAANEHVLPSICADLQTCFMSIGSELQLPH